MRERGETQITDFTGILREIGMTVEQSPYSIQPLDVEVFIGRGLKPRNAGDLNNLFMVIKDFLSTPIIKDSFTSHDQRRTVEDGLISQYGRGMREYINSNRLGGNQLSAIKHVPFLIGEILSPLGFTWSRRQEFDELFVRLPHSFQKHLTPEEQEARIQIIREISDLLYDLYNSVASFAKR